MAGQYIGIGGVARKVANQYIGIVSVARKIKNGFIGVGGVARKFLSSAVSPFYIYDGCTVGSSVSNYDGWNSSLTSSGMTITKNNTAGYLAESGVNDSNKGGHLDLTSRQFEGALGIARFNQKFDLSDYSKIHVTWYGVRYFRMGVGVSTSASVTSVDSFTKHTYFEHSNEKTTSKTIELDISSLSGEYYIYLYVSCDYSASSSGGKVLNCYDVWLTET